MAEEFELDLEGSEDINKTELRIKNLSSKVRETATERDEAKAATEVAEARAAAAEKKAEFLGSFTEVSSKYQGATEFRDAIEEKVLGGYSVEDATVSVLNANNRLIPQQQQVEAPRPITAGGGSAATMIPDNGLSKSVQEMTQAERREALTNPEIQGELESILRGR